MSLFHSLWYSKVLTGDFEKTVVTIRYEANPPKITPGADMRESISAFVERIRSISDSCNAIHLTENVLGFQRVSPLTVGRVIKREIPGLSITTSLRVRDKTEAEIMGFVSECIEIGLSGVLAVMGDPSRDGGPDSGQIPSAVVKKLQESGIGSSIDLYLSVSNEPNYDKITRKVEANPSGFMTQVVQSTEQVRDLAANLRGFKIIPIILFPSEKNKKSAEFLNLDLASYREDFGDFVGQIHDITGDVLITSPNDFAGLRGFLQKTQT